MIAYNLLDRASRRMLDGHPLPPFTEMDSPDIEPSTPGTPGSPTKSASDGKRARLIKYLGKPTSPGTWSRLMAPVHTSTSPLSSPPIEDHFFANDTCVFSPDSPTLYEDSPSPSAQLVNTNHNSSSSTLSSEISSITKFRQWSHDHRIKLSQDIPLWFQKIYRYHAYRKAKKQGLTDESAAAAAASLDLDKDSMMEYYREYKAARTNSTLRSPQYKSPGELIDDINTLSQSIPLFSPLHTLSLQELDDLRRDMFGAEYLSDPHDEECPLLEDPGSYDSESSAEQFKLSPESTPLLHFESKISPGALSSSPVPSPLLRRSKAMTSKDRLHQLTPEQSPSEIASSSSSSSSSSSPSLKSSAALRSSSHASAHSTGSSFSAMTVTVPTVRNHEFLSVLAENISDGQPIDPVYHRDEILPVNASTSTPDKKRSVSHGVIDIFNPKTFEPMLDDDTDDEGCELASSSPPSPPIEDTSYATIKFDEFAQVVLYDDNSRLKRGPSAHKRDTMRRLKVVHEAPVPLTTEQRVEIFKQHGSLRLYDTLSLGFGNDQVEFPSIRLSQSCRLQIPSFSLLSRSDSLAQSTKWKQMVKTQSQQTRSILKCKTNERCHEEQEFAQSLEGVGVADFMTVIDTVEKVRQKQLPKLGAERQQQMAKYYDTLGGKPSQMLSIF